MRALFFTLVVLTSLSSRAQSDDEHKLDIGFGVTPWIHLGPSWVTTSTNPPPEEVRHGMTVEATLQTLITFDELGFGAAVGYFGSGGQVEGSTDHLSLTGLQVMPLVMFSVLEWLTFHVKGGFLLFGSINNTEDDPVGAARVGGGLTIVFARMAAGDFAASIDVMHTWMTVPPARGLTELHITSGQIGLSFAFDPDALD